MNESRTLSIPIIGGEDEHPLPLVPIRRQSVDSRSWVVDNRGYVERELVVPRHGEKI